MSGPGLHNKRQSAERYLATQPPPPFPDSYIASMAGGDQPAVRRLRPDWVTHDARGGFKIWQKSPPNSIPTCCTIENEF